MAGKHGQYMLYLQGGRKMTVKELKDILAQYDDNARVTILDSEYGYIDITEIFKSDVREIENGYIRIA